MNVSTDIVVLTLCKVCIKCVACKITASRLSSFVIASKHYSDMFARQCLLNLLNRNARKRRRVLLTRKTLMATD